MTTTVHPDSSRSLRFLASLSTFLLNFSSQYSTWDFGSGMSQMGQRCQKHPLTNMASLCPGYAMSGLPGDFFQFSLYPGYPISLSMRWTFISGPVFFPLLAFIVFVVASDVG